jgi:pimeloyl-ACP methyl ester carboxylesterase
MLQNVGGAAALGILGRFELEQRIRLSAGIPAGQNANFNDNVNVSYTRLLSPEQRGEFGDTLNATTVRENNLNTMLAVLDSTRGNAAARFPANPKAIKAVRALPAPTGKFTVPTVMITTQYDAIVPSGNQQWYYDRLAVSAKKTKGAVAQYYTEPPQGGWTVYDEGAKGPNAAASTAAATSGVGHCNFAINGGVQLTNSVRALEVLVKGGTPKAADRIMFKTAGVIPDEFFEPEPLKRPLRAR